MFRAFPFRFTTTGSKSIAPSALLDAAAVEAIILHGLPVAADMRLRVLRVGHLNSNNSSINNNEVGSGFSPSSFYSSRRFASSVLVPFSPSSLRPGGTISGPQQFALVDAAFYACCLALTGKALAVTTNININFLAKPSSQSALLAEARAVKIGSRLHVYEADVFAIDGELVDRFVNHHLPLLRAEGKSSSLTSSSSPSVSSDARREALLGRTAIVDLLVQSAAEQKIECNPVLVAHATGTYSVPVK